MKLVLTAAVATLFAGAASAQFGATSLTSKTPKGESEKGVRLEVPNSGILFTAVNPDSGHTYHLLGEDGWNESRVKALAMGGDLVTIRSVQEAIWIFTTFSNFDGNSRGVWIGLNDEAVEGDFVWASGEPVTYTRWDPAGEPSNWTGFGGSMPQGEDYGMIYGPAINGAGFWNDMFNMPIPSYPGVVHGLVEIKPRFSAVPSHLSVSAGGQQRFSIDFTDKRAGQPYMILGSASGTAGVMIDGVNVQLTDDFYFQSTLMFPNSAPLSVSMGILDANGDGVGQYDLPPGSNPSLIGLTFYHAPVAFTGGGVAIATLKSRPMIFTP